MSIVRAEKGAFPYSTICNIGINDPNLSFKAKGILVYLLSKPDNWVVRVEDLAKRSKEKKPAVQSGLKELRDFGYASLETIRNEKGHATGKEWVLYEKPRPVQLKMSLSRQAENLVVGGQPTSSLTDVGKNRLSVKTDVGKSGHIVSTDYSVNTDLIVITDVVGVGEKTTPPPTLKNKKIEIETGVGHTGSSTATPPPPPQVAARPPAPVALPWQASADYQAGPVSFGEALKGRGVLPENTDTDYYYGRGAEWSANSAARTGTTPLAADWLGKIHGWAVADMNAGKLHTLQQQTYTLNDGTKYTISGNPAHQGGPADRKPKYGNGRPDPAACIASARRVAERLAAEGYGT